MSSKETVVKNVESMNGHIGDAPMTEKAHSKDAPDMQARVDQLMGNLRNLKDEAEAHEARLKVVNEAITRTEGAIMVLNSMIEEMNPQRQGRG